MKGEARGKGWGRGGEGQVCREGLRPVASADCLGEPTRAKKFDGGAGGDRNCGPKTGVMGCREED